MFGEDLYKYVGPIAALPNKIENINQNENTNLKHPLIKNIIDKVLGQTVNQTSKWSGCLC